MANKFNKGDTVVLKSGGPPMTIDQAIAEKDKDFPYEKLTDYRCIWFKGATADHGYYGDHAIEAYVPPKK
ncbi:MAG: DUF2158 domain-containing protein [Hyphomicrobiales bacterium]|nr:MAG: DUF2158 domain-containing protein [Hyphomicrobiales bacterium]